MDLWLKTSSGTDKPNIPPPIFRLDDAPGVRLSLAQQIAEIGVPAARMDLSAPKADVSQSDPELYMRLSQAILPRRRALAFRPDDGLVPVLASSAYLSVAPASGVTPNASSAAPIPPKLPTEPPMRLSQVLLPQRRAAKPPAPQSDNEPYLTLRPSALVRGFDGNGAVGQNDKAPSGGLAQQGQDSDEDPVGMPPVPLSQGGALQNAESDSSDTGRGGGWGLAPIKWGGNIGYNFRRSSSYTGSKATGQGLVTNIFGSSYIYAPWLASVSGSASVLTGVDRSQSGGDSSGGNQSQFAAFSGGGNVDLFSQSRFPAGISVSHDDSRTSANAVSRENTSNRFGLRQSYQTEDSQHRLSASYDYGDAGPVEGPRSTVHAFGANYSVPIGSFGNNVNTRYSVSDNGGNGQSATLFSVNTIHTMAPEENYSFSANSNYVSNRLDYGSGSGSGRTRGQYLQLGASGSWQPEFEDREDYPLALGGGLNYFTATSDSGGLSTQSSSINGSLSASYRFSPNLSTGASGSIARISSGEKNSLVSQAAANIAYLGDPLTFGKFSYNWNAGANTNWVGGSEIPSSVFVSSYAGHSLGRAISLSDQHTISLNVGQSVSLSQGQGSGVATSLGTSASAGYNTRLSQGFSGSVTVGVSDTMTQSSNGRQRYDSANVSLASFGALDGLSSLTTSVSFYWSQQSADNKSEFGQSETSQSQRMGILGSGSYSHARFAGIPRLRYSLSFAADTNRQDRRLLGDASAAWEPVRFSVDNSLYYEIGRLDTRLSLNMNETGGKKNALLFFQVTRRFGAF